MSPTAELQFSTGLGSLGLVAARLKAPEPTWTLHTDVLVVGSGVAGLSVVAGLVGSGLDVRVLTKGTLDAGSTRWAQGGIARATADFDDVDLHIADTLTAGAGLCEPTAVRRLAAEGRAAVEELARLGARFDLGPDGQMAQTREGGHSRARIVHAGGDASGAEVQRALIAAMGQATVMERAFLVDLDRDHHGAVIGATVAILGTHGEPVSFGRIVARATVLATGGLGHIYRATTNPIAVTGDGMAAALRAGAVLRDLEFVQFHPTVFAGGAGSGQTLLISEAVRGEGAVLIDAHGDRIMAGIHPRTDLAPRDIVAAREAQVMADQGVDHLFLDARGLGRETLERRFPTVLAGCREAGIDPVTQPIPVRPAQHYSSGGIAADLDGRTTVSGLFAVGEVAATGVHGANRLASNSLLEGLVAGSNLARLLRNDLPVWSDRRSEPPGSVGVDPAGRNILAQAMQVDAGVLRDPSRLAGLARLLDVTAPVIDIDAGPAGWEATNLHALSTVLVNAALARAESRGSHRRTDVTEPVPQWAVHTDTTMVEDGSDAVATALDRTELGRWGR